MPRQWVKDRELATVDVTVMGAGIFGLSIAWVCARRGARVRVIDPAGPGAGSSGGLVGALAPHTPERWEPKKQFQLESLLMAKAFWAQVDRVSGLNSGYGRVGRLQPIGNEHTLTLARERIDQAAELWRGQAVWQVRPRSDFPGWAPPSATGQLVFDTLSARLDPDRAVTSLTQALVATGVQVVQKGEPIGPTIWATGYQGLLDLSNAWGKEVGNGVKGQSVLLDYDRAGDAQIFSDGVHFVPHDNGTMGVGSTSERYFQNPTSTDGLLEDLKQKAFDILPQLANARVLKTWAGVRPRAMTRAPILGPYPGKPGHFIANGGFKIGFGMASKVAETMADLVLEGQDKIPDEFRVETCL